MKCRAAVMYEQGKPAPYAESHPLVVEEITLAPPGPDDVLVEIAAAGLCHSDLSAINGSRIRTLPAVVGHECSGIVKEVGSNVTELKADDHVVMAFVSSCGCCEFCQDGRANLCGSSWESRKNGTLQGGRRYIERARDNAVLNHYSGISAFAEYAVVSKNSLVKIDSSIPLEDASIFGCAVLTGVGAVVNTAKIALGSTVAVVGLGGVGLSAVLGAKASGAAEIFAFDVNDDKLELARSLGATQVFNVTDPDHVSQAREASRGGLQFVFEMAGVPAATETAYGIVRRGGKVVLAGLPDPSTRFELPLEFSASNEIAIVGSYMGSSVPRRDIVRFLTMYQSGQLPVNKLRSGTVTLDTINEGFDRLAQGKSVRDLLVFPS